jgi:hypothetical protein
MQHNYVLKTLFLSCFAFLFVYSGFIGLNSWKRKERPKVVKTTYNSTSYLKPAYKANISHLARIEIAVKDDLKSPNGKVLKVEFNDDTLALKPSDPQGTRGSTFIQIQPGTYTITWNVKNNKYTWPRYTTHSKQIKIESTDLWIHILIEGKNITIS